MTGYQTGLMTAAMLMAFSILLLGGNVIRNRMEEPVGRRKLAVCTLLPAFGLTLLLFLTGSDAAYLIRAVILCSFLPLIAMIDRRERIIPNHLLLWMFIYWGLAVLIHLLHRGLDTHFLMDSLVGGLIGATPLLARLICRGGIGMGDIKLFILIGLYVGKENILRAMFLSLVTALVYILAMRIRRKIGRREELSFGPYIAMGTMLMVFMNIPIF